jgi:hypothetical protein
MVINQQCLLGSWRAKVAKDYWVTIGWKHTSINANLFHHQANQLGTLFDTFILGGNAGLTNQIPQLLNEAIPIGLNICVD